jgi:predicted HicB family RNase H-like nuclease
VSQELRDRQLTIRIPQRIHDAIEAQADAERRSVADVINNALEKLYPPPAPTVERRRR